MASSPFALPTLNADTVLAPSFPSAMAKTLSQLRQIDRVEIPARVKRDGHSFYTINVFFKSSTNHIPTTQHRLIASPCSASRRAPDAIIYQRLSDVSALRYDLRYEAFSPIKQCSCSGCRGMINLFQQGLEMPHFHMTWFRDSTRVCKDLEAFLNAAIQATAPSPAPQRCSCESTEQSQSRLHRFLFEHDTEDATGSWRDRQRKPPSRRPFE